MTKKPLPTTWPSPQPVLAMRAVLAIADSASARLSASAGRSTGGAGAGSKPAKRGGSPVVSSSAMSWPATIVGGGSRSPAMRSATDSRAADARLGAIPAASMPPMSQTRRTTCATPTTAPPTASSGRRPLFQRLWLIVVPPAAPTASPTITNAPRPTMVATARIGCSMTASWSLEHGRQQQRQAEPDGGADETEHRPEEAGARAGDQADHEQDEDARVDEVHGPPSLAAGRKAGVGPSSAPV